jgi:hypothetical protein
MNECVFKHGRLKILIFFRPQCNFALKPLFP